MAAKSLWENIVLSDCSRIFFPFGGSGSAYLSFHSGATVKAGASLSSSWSVHLLNGSLASSHLSSKKESIKPWDSRHCVAGLGAQPRGLTAT